MTVTRRLFARILPAAPAAAALSVEGMMASAVEPATFHGANGVSPAPPTDYKVWESFRKAFRPRLRDEERRTKYVTLTGGYSPDILALRAVSPQFKARMLAAELDARQSALMSLENRLRRQFGLEVDD